VQRAFPHSKKQVWLASVCQANLERPLNTDACGPTRPVADWPVCVLSTSETETSPVAWERKHQANPERVTLNQSPTKKESGRETASWGRPEIKVPLSLQGLLTACGLCSAGLLLLPWWVHSSVRQPSSALQPLGEFTLEACGWQILGGKLWHGKITEH
jgi:hypothetical protein